MADSRSYEERPKYEPRPEPPETYTNEAPQNNSADHDRVSTVLNSLRD